MAFPRIVGKVDRNLYYPSALHYSRRRYPVSLRGARLLLSHLLIPALILGITALDASGQYAGQAKQKTKDTPVLRSIAVLEWTGPEGKPKSSRLVPVTVYDGVALQDGNVYLARPLPLAVMGQVEYQLEKNGKTIGLFDIKNAGQEQGSWVGYGSWKPLQAATPKAAKPTLDEGAEDDDRPTLHRKKSASSDGGSSGGTGTASTAPPPPDDPDRPTLHKKPSGSDTGSPGSEPAPDPDRPTLHTPASTPTAADNQPAAYTDPDRPLLKRGKSTGSGPEVLPSLMGMPQEMQQAVAVSDTRNRPEHPWSYTWANPEDEIKMKESMEAIARDALGLKSLAPSPKRTSSKTKAKSAAPQHPAELPPLLDEQFRVFELAYGSGATQVPTARTEGPLAQQKFVTLIAQPDLYGNVLILFKNVADGAHLDDSPRMRLVDAVDVMADNRAALLFELRGATQRQFALYRVMRGTCERIFETGGGQYGVSGE